MYISQKLEASLQQTEKTLLLEREQQWEAERSRFIAELTERDALLQRADSHMETEITKLQTEMQEQLQEVAELRQRESLHSTAADSQDRTSLLQQQYDLRTRQQIEELRQQLSKEHESDLETQRQRLDKEYTERTANSQEELQQTAGRLADARTQLKELYTKYNGDVKQLATRLEELESCLQTSSQEVQAARQELEAAQAREAEMEMQLRKAEKQRQEVAEAMRTSESEHATNVAGHKERQRELKEKIQHLEQRNGELKGRVRDLEQEIQTVRSGQEQEHQAAVHGLQAKIVELCKGHSAAMESLRRQQVKEKHELTCVIDQLTGSKRDSPTQVSVATQSSGNRRKCKMFCSLLPSPAM